MATVLRLGVNGLALWGAVRAIDGLVFTGPWPALVVMALAMAAVNAFVRPLAHIFSVPLRLLPLGGFIVGLNVLALSLLLWASEQLDLGLSSSDLGATVGGALAMAAVSWIMSAVFTEDRRYS